MKIERKRGIYKPRVKHNKILFWIIIILFLLLILILLALKNVESAQEEDKINKNIIDVLDKKVEERVYIEVQSYEEKSFFKDNLKNYSDVKKEVISGLGKNRSYESSEFMISAKINKKDLNDLIANKGIKKIGIMPSRNITLSDSVPLVNASLTRNLHVNGVNLTGIGQTICIIDTGINYNHVDFGNCYGNNDVSSNCKVIGGWDYCPDDDDCLASDSDPIDVEGHGTHVAGIAAANGAVKGVAPGAKIVMIKAYSNVHGVFYDDVLRNAIDWCIRNSSAFNISVISMSLGGGLYTNYCDSQDDPYDITGAINNATSKNITVVVAAGNSGSTTQISSPACVTNSTAIGSIRKDDSTIDFNRNSLVKLIAPGVFITSTSISGGYEVLSGTSMATPHAAGAVAIVKEYLSLSEVKKTPKQIENILNITGKTVYDSGSGKYYSRIDVYSSLLNLDITPPNITLTSPENNLRTLNRSINFTCTFSDFYLTNTTFYVWNSSAPIYNESKSLSGSLDSEVFNLTLIPGDYNWSCTSTDSKANRAIAGNSTLHISNIQTILSSPSNNYYSKLKDINFTCNSQTNNSVLSNVSFLLWNSSRSLIYSETKNISGSSNDSIFNYTFSQQSTYLWNCITVNNNSESIVAGLNFSFGFDDIKPNITLISPADSYSSDSQEIVFLFNITENLNISNCSLILKNIINSTNSSIYNFSNNHSFSSILSPASYLWSINCSDLANNLENSSTRTLTVNSVAISIVNQDSSGGGGGGGGGGNSDKTISYSELLLGSNNQFSSGERIIFEAGDRQNHTLTLNKIFSDHVNLTIRSNPINLLLNIGEEKKISLSGDYYELLIRLNSIKDSKANITLKSIYEKIKLEGENTLGQNESQERPGRELFNEEVKNYGLEIVLLIALTGLALFFIVYISLKLTVKKLLREKVK